MRGREEVVVYWRMLMATLWRRGLLERDPSLGLIVFPEADAYLLPDRVVFVLDAESLGGVKPEMWTDKRLWARWRAALAGRRVFVSRNGGLAITVARDVG